MKKAVLAISLAASAAFSPVASAAGFFTADQFADWVQRPGERQSLMMGYALATSDGLIDVKFCPAKGSISGNEIVRLSLDLLEEHPKLGDLAAYAVIATALMQKHPCRPAK